MGCSWRPVPVDNGRDYGEIRAMNENYAVELAGLIPAVCGECGGSSWGIGKRSQTVRCMICANNEWDGDPRTFPVGASVSQRRYPLWHSTQHWRRLAATRAAIIEYLRDLAPHAKQRAAAVLLIEAEKSISSAIADIRLCDERMQTITFQCDKCGHGDAVRDWDVAEQIHGMRNGADMINNNE